MKIALVIPWFGKELKGGAEQQAWQIAKRLTDRNIDIEVLTTCSKEFLSDWSENFYTVGDFIEDNISIKRFKVKKRDTEAFDRVNLKLMQTSKESLIPGVSPLSKEEEQTFLDENIYSPDLQNYIVKQKDNYDIFIFLPYLFPNIIKGINAVKEKAVVQPCLHDESYAYLDCVQDNFYNATSIIYLSDGEYQVAQKIYGASIINKSKVLYAGVEINKNFDIKYERYLLYLGRRDIGKNTHLLIESFDKFIDETDSDLKLLIAGVGDLPIKPRNKNIVDLGLVSEEEKTKLLSQCLALVNPSENESFSRVIFEAWYAKKPIIIHKKCLATYRALLDSNNSGFFAEDEASFIEVCKKLDTLDINKLKKMGEMGFIYAKKIADWDNVIDKYIDEFKSVIINNKIKNIPQNQKAIHQILPNLSYGDAISNQARAIRKLLRSQGYHSKIFVRYIDPKVQDECEPFEPKNLNENDGLIYHHSIGFEYTQNAVDHKGKKALIYHNITPKDFFEPYNEEFAKILQDGRNDLKNFSNIFDFNYGVSQFNIDELNNNNFRDCKVLPLIISSDKWNFIPDSEVIRQYSNNNKNILFTGRLAPNKKQTDLVKMMSYLVQINPNTRLIIVGSGDKQDPYVKEFYNLINFYNLEDNVTVTGHVSEAELKSYFMIADLFVSMSEHEGFGVPLIEAMWFDIPVVAYKSTAVPETLAEAAFMFTDKKDMLSIAGLVNIILNDEEIRVQIIKEQRVVRDKFSFKNIENQYLELIEDLVNG